MVKSKNSLFANDDNDIAVFAKSISNGYSLGVICGTNKVMRHAEESFISSTNWTERTGHSAALATIQKYLDLGVDNHIIQIGQYVKKGWQRLSEKHNLPIDITGIDTLQAFTFLSENSTVLSAALTNEMLKMGYLAGRQFKPSYAHTIIECDIYLQTMDKVFNLIKEQDYLRAFDHQLPQQGFKRLVKE